MDQDCDFLIIYRILPEYRHVIYMTAIKHGTLEDFEYIWNKFLTEPHYVERERLLRGLTGTQNFDLMKRSTFIYKSSIVLTCVPF